MKSEIVSRETTQKMVSIGSVVVPVTLLSGLLSLAWFAGMEHARLNYVEAAQHEQAVLIKEAAKALAEVSADVKANARVIGRTRGGP